MHTGRITYTARSISGLVHGAGSSGNSQLLRTQKIWDARRGCTAYVPFVSANALKGVLRRAGMHAALEAMGVERGSLPLKVVQLLFSGGALEGGGARAVDISAARQVAKLFPWLSVCGYAAGNTMTASKLRIDHIELVCAENAARLPPELTDAAEARVPSGAFRGEHFGTRHEPTRDPSISPYLLTSDAAAGDLRLSDGLAKGKAEKGDSAQMIYDWQHIIPGALWWGGIGFSRLDDMELASLQASMGALASAPSAGGVELALGGKRNVGASRLDCTFRAELLAPIMAAPATEARDLIPVGAMHEEDGSHKAEATLRARAYADHLAANAKDILALLREVAG